MGKLTPGWWIRVFSRNTPSSKLAVKVSPTIRAFPTMMMFSAKNVNIYQLPCRMTDYDLFCKTHNSLHYPEVKIVQCNFSEILQGDQHSATKFIDDNNWE